MKIRALLVAATAFLTAVAANSGCGGDDLVLSGRLILPTISLTPSPTAEPCQGLGRACEDDEDCCEGLICNSQGICE